jgi:hypothetical protein
MSHLEVRVSDFSVAAEALKGLYSDFRDPPDARDIGTLRLTAVPHARSRSVGRSRLSSEHVIGPDRRQVCARAYGKWQRCEKPWLKIDDPVAIVAVRAYSGARSTISLGTNT